MSKLCLLIAALCAMPACMSDGPTETDTEAALSAQAEGASCSLPSMIAWTTPRKNPPVPIYACSAHEPSAITLADGDHHTFSSDSVNVGALEVACSNGQLATVTRTCQPPP